MGLETRDQKQKLGLLIKISYSPSIPQTIFERIPLEEQPLKIKQAFSIEKDLLLRGSNFLYFSYFY